MRQRMIVKEEGSGSGFTVPMKKPTNLRVEMAPYPHLRDDEGCVLARDYINQEKIDFILQAVREKIVGGR